MSHPDSPDNRSPLDVWQSALDRARVNPFLFQLLLKQWQRILKRLAYFYAQLASLPRRQRRALQRALATSLVGAALLLALSSAPVVHAATITVGGACTLDEAITNANNDTATFPDCAAGSGADTITLTGNVTLGTDTPGALPNISTEITLEGNNFTISGANSFRVFTVTSTGDFTINNTTIQYGLASNGGAIFNDGTLVINNSTLGGNHVDSRGGAIYNYSGATLTITNSTLSGNEAEYGGAIYNYSGATLTITNSTLSGNTGNIEGGAIYNAFYATLTITNSTLSENYAAGDGGAIYNDSDATLTITNSTLSGNHVESRGGAIYNDSDATLTITNSTLSGNSAAGDGGAIYNDNYSATLTITNSTLSGNSADDEGGAIFNGNYATLTLNRTLISGNTATSDGDEIYNDAYGSITANNYNLFGHSGITNADAFFNFTPGANDITATSDGTTPTLLANILNTTLADNGSPVTTPGGVVQTLALVSGSPAIDQAPNADCAAAPVNGVDQRTLTRNVDDGPPSANDCDIGAFELQAPTAVNVTHLRGDINKNGNVVLHWRTVTESQIAGFNVFRQGKQGKWKQINAKFKSAKHPGDALGDKYRFADKKVLHGKVYRYKIEVHYLDGHTEWTHVVKVKTP